LKQFVETPKLFIQGWQDHEMRQQELASRNGFRKWWYWLNSSSILVWPWFLIDLIFCPLSLWMKNSRRLLLFLEKICRFLSSHDGISNYLFVGKQRAMTKVDPHDIPIEKLGRKEIWD
jgi:hypothetical protein